MTGFEEYIRQGEPDRVAARIAKILFGDTFSFSPVEYIAIHRQLFTGIYKFAGKIRDYNRFEYFPLDRTP